jgi:hypothetical protein
MYCWLSGEGFGLAAGAGAEWDRMEGGRGVDIVLYVWVGKERVYVVGKVSIVGYLIARSREWSGSG